MKKIAVILSLLVLAACGADGPPIKPTVNTNVSIGSDGVRTSTGVTVTSGPVNIGVGF